MEKRESSRESVSGECGEHIQDGFENMIALNSVSVVRMSHDHRVLNSRSANTLAAGAAKQRRPDLSGDTKTKAENRYISDIISYLDSAETVLLGLNESGIIRFVNNRGALLLDRNEADLIGRNWLDICVRKQDRASAQRRFTQLLRNQAEPQMVFEKKMFRGKEERLMEWKLSVLRDAQQRVTGAAVIGNDKTSWQTAVLSLESKTRQAQRFAQSIAHDLKNPAISLQGLTKLLTRKYRHLLDEHGRIYCETIMATAEHLYDLADSICSFAATTDTPVRFAPLNFKELITVITEEFSPQLASQYICLQARNVTISISADRISLLRVLRNLVENALKYGGPRLSSIEIGCQEEENHHVISVQDNGNGFAEEHTAHLFNAYYRITADGDTGGAGLGLAIVRDIATQHGGTAWAQSQIGHGAIFYVSIRKGLES